MSTVYLGDNSFRTHDVTEFEDSEGLDYLTVVRKGKNSELAAESALWPRGQKATSLGYANMYLQTKRTNAPTSNYSTLTLEFAGFLSNTFANPISIEDSISLQSTTLVTDEADSDGNLVNVQVKFMAQTTATRWIHRGATAPVAPLYPAIVPSDVSTNTIFDPFPADYPGTLQKQVVGRLMQFDRSELARGVWAVTEVWMNRVEPDED